MRGVNTGGLKLSPMEWHLIYTLIKQVDMCGDSLESRRDLLGELLTDLIARKNQIIKEDPESKKNIELTERLSVAWDDFKKLNGRYNPKMDISEYYFEERSEYVNDYFSLLLELKSIIEEYTIFGKEAFKSIPLPGEAHARMQEEFADVRF